MKKMQKLWGGVLFSMVFLTSLSCEKEESMETLPEGEHFEVQELKYADEADLITEEVVQVSEVVYEADELGSAAKGGYTSGYLPDCVTITTVINGSTKVRTIDFGTGCELPNGNVLAGSIVMSYDTDMEQTVKVIGLELHDFFFNEVAVAGSARIERMRRSDSGNPRSVAVAEFNAEWPDGSTASFQAERSREWIEGYGSGHWGDNIFEITGFSDFTGPAGNRLEKTVLTPLRREMACRFIVSGILEIRRNGNKVSLDFGDGECDAIGILTRADGTSEEIALRRFRN